MVKVLSLENSQRFSFSVGLTFAARVLMAANSVLAGILVARLLGAESLGALLVLNVTVAAVIQFSGFSLFAANTYFTAEDHGLLVPAAVNGVFFAILSGIVCSLILWLCSPYFLPGVPSGLVIIGLLGVPFQLITIILTNLFLARGEVKKFNFLDLLNQSFVLINAIAVLLFWGGGLWMLVSFNAATSAVVMLLTVILFIRYIHKQSPETTWSGDLGLLRRMVKYAFKGHILWISMILVYRLDLLVVNYFRGAAEASVYAVATQCTLFLLLLPNAVSHILQMRVATTQDEGGTFTSLVARHTSLILGAACLVSVPGSLLLTKVYGPAFADLSVQIWLLLPGVFFVGVQVVLAQYFVGTGLPILLPISWVATLMLNASLNIAIVPVYGARGAAVVSTICYTLVFVIVFAFFKWRTGHGLREVLLPRSDEFRRMRAMLNPKAATH